MSQVIGMTITDVLESYGIIAGWLDYSSCLLQLNNEYHIHIPFNKATSVAIYDYDPVRSKQETNDIYAKIDMDYKHSGDSSFKKDLDAKSSLLKKFITLLGIDSKVEDKRGFIVGQQIRDFLWQENDGYSGYFELSNGSLIQHLSSAPSGTGMAGLSWYENIQKLDDDLILRYSNNYIPG